MWSNVYMKDVVPEHHIQKKLFNKLIGAESLRYSELKPKDIEANLFMYHLKELMKMGIVDKIDGKYQVSKQGSNTATRFSIREQGMRIMPAAISVIALKAQDGQWLLYKRSRQPYIGSLGFPSGKVHLGDALQDAAYRELDEKCGYTRTEIKLAHRGVFNLVVHEPDTSLKNHIIGQIWYGVVSEKKEFANHAGQTFWADWTNENYDEFIPGFKEIIEALESPDFFYLDMKFDA
jgi:ADP-ribose pyrophosphatase YjhB (NUDIX family)